MAKKKLVAKETEDFVKELGTNLGRQVVELCDKAMKERKRWEVFVKDDFYVREFYADKYIVEDGLIKFINGSEEVFVANMERFIAAKLKT